MVAEKLDQLLSDRGISEDEIVEETIRNRPLDQLDGIRFIAESFVDIEIWVRIHPRLINLDKNFVNTVIDICNSYKNVKIITASADVDSYQLIKSSNMVVGFGSTTVIEAAYMKKTSINIGPSIFENLMVLNICIVQLKFITL